MGGEKEMVKESGIKKKLKIKPETVRRERERWGDEGEKEEMRR